MAHAAEPSSADVAEHEHGDNPELKRVIGPGLLLLFIVGDILGTGIYALTGQVAKEVGGAVWLPFILAFSVAMLTAFSYLELVTKYPQAAGAALYTHKAFGIHFVTFLVTFTVMSSGITSASTASRAFAANLVEGFGLDVAETVVTLIAMGFMLLVAAVNFRGVGESVKANVVLTMVELSGLLLVIMVGVWAMSQGKADFSQVTVFETSAEKSAFLSVTAATSLAFFAMVGFEDSVNMAEETKDPVKTFPKIMISGFLLTGLVYVLVSITAVALVPVDQLGEGDAPLLKVVEAGAPGVGVASIFPFISMFAVANTALINMLMASRLLYGMAREGVVPGVLGKVHRGRRTPHVSILFTTVLSLGLIWLVSMGGSAVRQLGGTTALLLLVVFTIVNVAVLILRRDVVDREHFRTRVPIAVLGALTCAYLVGPWTGRDTVQYTIAGWLLLIGVALWAITWVINRAVYGRRTYMRDTEHLTEEDRHPRSPLN